MKTPEITVANVRSLGPKADWGPEVVYVGRANGRYRLKQHALHNPFKLASEKDREDSMARYREHLSAALLDDDSAESAALRDLAKRVHTHGKLTLVCWCKPKACHADFIAEVLRQRLETSS